MEKVDAILKALLVIIMTRWDIASQGMMTGVFALDQGGLILHQNV